jgi:hypothetical protein
MSDVETLIKNVMADELLAAGNQFNQVMNAKIADSLQQAKVDAASSVFSAWPGTEEVEGPEDEEDELEEDELEDDELEDDEDFELTDEEIEELWDDDDLDIPEEEE